MTSAGGFFFIFAVPVAAVAVTLLVAWALVMVIRVAYRWLLLHPAHVDDRADRPPMP